VNKEFRRTCAGSILPLALVLLAACRSTPPGGATSESSPMEINVAMTRAAESKQPLTILVAEPGQNAANDRAVSAFLSREVQSRAGASSLLLDIGNSRNRATATRFHPVLTPLLVCLSSTGITVSRDEKPITKKLILRRMQEAGQVGPSLDAQYVALQQAAAAGNTAARMALASFLMAHHNAIEAIPTLEEIAHSAANDGAVRTDGWVMLAKAHLWIAEPEKGRHEAETLLRELGARIPEAQAGGHLVLGLQDVNLKRAALARDEFRAAMSAAPGSSYAVEAADALSQLR